MRFYSFTNFYLSSIQQGIQPGHVAVEILNRYSQFASDERAFMAWEWARKHKTFICLNGGNNADIQSILTSFQEYGNPYPFAPFYEDRESLGEVLTSVGIILPERIYDTAAKLRSGEFWIDLAHIDAAYIPVYGTLNDADIEFELTQWEYKLIQRLNACSMAK